MDKVIQTYPCPTFIKSMSAQSDFKDFKKDDQLTIQEAASLLEISTKTLRRWESQGIITPTRTPGNQRRYSVSQIKRLKDPVTKKPIVINFLPKDKITNSKNGIGIFRYIKILIPALASILIFASIVYLNQSFSIGKSVESGLGKIFSSSKSKPAISEFELSDINHDSQVLAENTALTDYIFQINVPSLFSQQATFSAGITAPNIIYDLIAGSGIEISSGQTPTVSISDELNSFGTITVGTTQINAGTNGDTFTIAAGSNITIATDTTNKKITLSSSDSDTFADIDDGDDGQVLTLEDGDPVWADATGSNTWTSASGSVYPTTTTDNVVIGGNTSTSFQLEVNGSQVGKALVSLNETGNQNILVASASGTNVLSITQSGLTFGSGSHLILNTDDFTDLTGSGLALSSNSLSINLTTSGTTGSTSSNSGLEVSSSGLTLIKGCADNEILKWSDAGGWACSADNGGSGTNYWQLNSNTLAPGGSATVTDKLVLGGNTTTPFQFEVNGRQTGKALVALNETGDQNILTASASGTTVFNLDRSGSLLVAAGQGIDTLAAGALAVGNTTATSVSVCNSAACDTLTLGTNTDADTITIGEANDNVSLTDAQWSITGAGAGAFASLSSSGAIAANGGITFDNSTDTLGAFTLAGTLDAGTNLITNIGDTGTDFISGGGLTLAGDFSANGNSTIGNATTDTLTFTARVAQDSDLLPITATGTSDLGSSSLPWDNVYAVAFTENGTALSAAYAPINANFVTVTANGTLTGETGIDALTTAISTTNTLNVDGATTLAGVTIDANSNLTLLSGTGKLGVGLTAVSKLDVQGAVVGKALVSFDETGDQNILTASASGNTVLQLTRRGDIISGFTLLDGSSQANGSGSGSVTLIVDDGTNFTVGNYVQINNTGNGNCGSGTEICYAKITAKATNTLTIGTALAWADNAPITEYHIPEIGATNTATTLTNRYGRGYFIGGTVAGNGSTFYGDQRIYTSDTTSEASPGLTISTGTTTTSGNSGSIVIDTGTAAGTAGSISIGNSNTSSITIGRSGITTNIPGSLSLSGSAGLTVSGAVVGRALAVLNETGDQNILVGSASGTTVFTLNRSGSLLVAAGQGIDTLAAGALAIGNTTATSVSICNSAACDTLSLGTNTDADTITIGEANDDVSLTDAQWSITGAGAGSFASLSSSGAIAANGGITFNDATDTLGAHTLSGTLDAGTNLITNIGDTGTDFVSGGGLTLAGDLSANGNTTIGNATTDSLTFTARVAADSDLLPIGTTGTNDLGSASLPWDNVYAVSLTENGTALSGTYAPINANFVTVTANGTLTGETGIDALTTAISTTNTLNVDGATTLAGVTVDAGSNVTLSAGTGKLGVGLSPVSKLDVQGAVVGKALASLDETGDQNILVGSASGTTVFTLNRSGSLLVAAAQGLDTLAAGALAVGNTTATSVSVCNSAACDTLTLGTNTDADTITIGEANDDVSLTDAQWSITAAGAGAFASLSSSGAIAANGGITFNDATDTLGAHTLAGTLDAGTNLITNIGDTGTDFVSGGGLTLAGTLTTNGTLTVNSDVITLGNATTDAITFTGRVAQDSDLLPITTTGTSDLGSSSLPWDNLYSGLISQPFSATTGTLHSISAPSSVTLTGTLVGQAIDLSTNITDSNNDITGQTITFPATTFTASTAYRGINITSGALVQNQAATVGLFRGLEITNPNITRTAGTGLTATGNRIVTGTITTAGTQYGLNIVGQGVSAGTLQAVRIENITGDAGAETAIAVLDGWDTDLAFNDATVAIVLSSTNGQLDFTDGTNTLFTIDDAGTTGNLDFTGTITAGSGDEVLTLSTGKIDADAITLISSGTTGETSSRSGLETTSDGLSLITGCADGELIEWTDAGGWACAADNDSGGAGAFTASGGVITKTTGTDQLSLRFDGSALGEVQLEIQNTTAAAAITADAAQINLTGGSGITTDNVDGLYINIEGADGTSTDVSALHLDVDPIAGSSDDTFTGLLIDSVTGTSAVENAITVGSGWDANLLFVDTTTQIQISDSGTLTFENVTGTDFLTLSAGALVATGSVSGVTTLSSSGDWTWTATTPNITINDNETFTIVDAATVDTFTVNTSGSLFSYSDGTNSFTFDVDSGPLYAGTARPAKKVTLVPEYPGAVFTPDGGSNVGTLTSDFCSEDGLRNVNTNATPTNASPCDSDTAGEEHNYYTWTSQTASQDYDLWVRWQVPSDFAAFAASDAVQAYGWRTDGTNVVEISMYDTAGSADATSVNVATGTAAWTLTTVDSAPAGTYTQGSYVTFKIHLANDTAGDHVKAGEISINYLARF